jgi:anti-anti-sigma factor
MTTKATMTARLEFGYNRAVIHLRGSFDFPSRNTLCDSLTKAFAKQTIDHVEIDLHEVSYIDSSGLGQLLVAQDKADKLKKRISLVNPQGMVKEVLKVTQFHQRFMITPPLES